MRKAIKRLPKLAYLIWDNQGSDTEDDYYLIAGESLEGHASQGSRVVVGTYKLVEESTVQLVTKVSQRKLRSR